MIYLRNCRLKNMYNLKVEFYVLFGGLSEDFKPRETASQMALRDCPEEVREEPGYIGVLQQTPSSWNIKRLLFIKESRISQVKELSIFLYMGRCKNLGSSKSFL